MAEAKDKWDEVGERFGQLGRQLKDRFDANAAFGPDERETVTDALRQVDRSARRRLHHDRRHLPRSGDARRTEDGRLSIADALSATLRDVSDAIKRH